MFRPLFIKVIKAFIIGFAICYKIKPCDQNDIVKFPISIWQRKREITKNKIDRIDIEG